MYENMNNKVARTIKIFGNILGVCGVIAGLSTLVIGADSIYDVYSEVTALSIFIAGFNSALIYVIAMFIFWGLAEIIELLSVIKANTTNQVELTAQGNNITPNNISNSDTSVSEN